MLRNLLLYILLIIPTITLAQPGVEEDVKYNGRVLMMDLVGIGIETPNSTHHVSGSISRSVNLINNDTTLDNTFYIVEVDVSDSGVTINLPPISQAKGRVYIITKVDNTANIVTISPDGSETIDGESSNTDISIEGDDLTIVAGTTQWLIIES